MVENESRREMLSAISILMLFCIGIGSVVGAGLLFNAAGRSMDNEHLAVASALFAIAAAYTFGQLVFAFKR